MSLSRNLASWVVICGFVSLAERPAAAWKGFESPVRFPMGAPVVSFHSNESPAGHALVVGTNGRGASVFSGYERGAFRQRTDIPGGFVVSAAMGDFNSDAIPDLAVPSYFEASFTI